MNCMHKDEAPQGTAAACYEAVQWTQVVCYGEVKHWKCEELLQIQRGLHWSRVPRQRHGAGAYVSGPDPPTPHLLQTPQPTPIRCNREQPLWAPTVPRNFLGLKGKGQKIGSTQSVYTQNAPIGMVSPSFPKSC